MSHKHFESSSLHLGENNYELWLTAHVLNFLELDEKQYLNLANQIKTNKGRIRVIIHPFHNFYHAPERVSSQIEKVEQGTVNFAKENLRLSKTGQNSKAPVFLFEEESNIENTQRILYQAAGQGLTETNTPASLFAVPTYDRDSTPKLTTAWESKRIRELAMSDDFSEQESWIFLCEKFRDLGVTTIILGGNYYISEEHKNDFKFKNKDGNPLEGCVDFAENNFKAAGFKVEFSRGTYPKAFGNTFKQALV